VVKRRRLPRSCRVTNLTRPSEATRCVAWGRRRGELRLVAVITRSGHRGELALRMTGKTRDGFMRARQRKRCHRMVKAGIPGERSDGMAVRAHRRESGRSMAWIGRIVVVQTVATDARGRNSKILTVRCTSMTILAVERRVFSDKRKPRCLVSLHHVWNFPGLI
jgi:hypothetical protein